ncbi:alpha/beta hydrolase [Paraflavitalea sp. CAU 1676]|uniref:alpha/beta hydrolase n=1 Tax=Paraflavitalea sp. CAU 1676 TaxID=3032598 RepID=UPI0023DAEEB3|nr:alpha/beta hydrolase [Paraflavitalea sp. CAU 1676]MDF2189471.1 alpha/beta hydrolase [Paraflavitalea sp. CAU 1676]
MIMIIGSFYVLICLLAFFLQEKLIFFPEKLAAEHVYRFSIPHEELNFSMKDGVRLNGVLFKADSARGTIFYLHGNAGSIDGWGELASFYVQEGFNVFMLDYRGYGKSGGSISSQQQLFDDVQAVYEDIRRRAGEDSLIILGYSIGTGPASWLASRNNARMLILQAPYYSLTDMMGHNYPILPRFLLKYKFTTNKFLPLCKMPVVIFHGDADEVIYYGSAQKLSRLFKEKDTLITLQGGSHNGMSEREDYQHAFRQVVNR